MINELGQIGAVRRWTRLAVECYNRGCTCNGCYYNTFNHKCKMKATVLELVRRFGKPEGDIDD